MATRDELTDHDEDRSTDRQATDPERIEDLEAQLDLLTAENRRLRAAFADAKRTTYHRTAIGLAAVGLLAGLAGLVVPTGSNVLFALAGTGLFAAVLTYFLTPERFIPADVGERVYRALAMTLGGIADDLDLSDRRVYVPIDRDGPGKTDANSEDGGDGETAANPAPSASATDVRLFVPQNPSGPIPAGETLRGTIVVDEAGNNHGLSVRPTGAELFASFRTALNGPLASTPRALAEQLCDGLVEDFELARSTDVDLDAEAGRLSVRIDDPVYGEGDGFDHPIGSFLAVGLTAGLDRPIDAECTAVDPLTITYRWETPDE